MKRRLRNVLAGMAIVDFHEEQEHVFEDTLEADMPSPQGLKDLGAETQQVG